MRRRYKARRPYRYRYRGSRTPDYARARWHIAEARRLSAELGGTDQDVKEYFFSLQKKELAQLLDAYEKQYGIEPRRYAEAILPKWRSGHVTMSGMVATRLFDLLPPRMPPDVKYRLTERLWRHVGPSSRKLLLVGPDAELDQVVTAVREHIDCVCVQYAIPAAIEEKFLWLAAGDVALKQELLNHLREAEKALAVEQVKTHVPPLLEHIRSEEGRNTHEVSHVLEIGKHTLELIIDPARSGVALVEPSAYPPAAFETAGGWFLWVLAAALVLWLVSGAKLAERNLARVTNEHDDKPSQQDREKRQLDFDYVRACYRHCEKDPEPARYDACVHRCEGR